MRFLQKATIQEVTYTTSDSNVATIDQNGKVKAVGPGYVNITAKAYNGTSVVHKFRVYQKIKKIKSEGRKNIDHGETRKSKLSGIPFMVYRIIRSSFPQLIQRSRP